LPLLQLSKSTTVSERHSLVILSTQSDSAQLK